MKALSFMKGLRRRTKLIVTIYFLNYARVKVSTIRIIYCIIEKQKNNVPCGI